MIYVLRWDIWLGGRRKGAHITVREPEGERDISGTVTGWLDGKIEPCARKHAKYCLVRRWSYSHETSDIPRNFAVPLSAPPAYGSKTFHPAEDKGGAL